MSKRVEQIKKRDGRIVPFDESRVLKAITKAAEATGFKDEKEIERLYYLQKTIVRSYAQTRGLD